jgi:predicted cupin superfamily sugar epimerase
MPATDLTADEIIEKLNLTPHPEGGWFAETFRDPAPEGGRSHGTAIYYLLKSGEASHWHRVDATEIWHWYAGGPLALKLSPDGKSQETLTLGPSIANG